MTKAANSWSRIAYSIRAVRARQLRLRAGKGDGPQRKGLSGAVESLRRMMRKSFSESPFPFDKAPTRFSSPRA